MKNNKKKKNKVEIIKCESSNKKCYICDGTGIVIEEGQCCGQVIECEQQCHFCEGTGIFKDNHYILIANGMAWDMDTIK